MKRLAQDFLSRQNINGLRDLIGQLIIDVSLTSSFHFALTNLLNNYYRNLSEIFGKFTSKQSQRNPQRPES